MAKATTSQKPANRPEAKFGPFPGGISIAVWINEVQTDGGRRPMRSITVSPRRYRDAQSGEWKDAPSYRPSDIPALVFGLEKALDFIFSNPLPGQEESHDEAPY